MTPSSADDQDALAQSREILEATGAAVTTADSGPAALTAFARSEDRVRALRSGFQVHLSKPIDPAELMAAAAALARSTKR